MVLKNHYYYQNAYKLLYDCWMFCKWSVQTFSTEARNLVWCHVNVGTRQGVQSIRLKSMAI